MLDPITAIGLASSIVAFVDFGSKVIKCATEIHHATDGTLLDNASSQIVAEEMKALATRLKDYDRSQLVGGQQRALGVLAEECHSVSKELITLLESLKPADPKSKLQSLRASFKAHRKDAECKDLERKLDNCRSQLAVNLNFSNLVSVDMLANHIRGNSEALAALQMQSSELTALVSRMGLDVLDLMKTQKTSLERMLMENILESLKFDDLRHREDSIEEAHEKTFSWIFGNTAKEQHESALREQSALQELEFFNWLDHKKQRVLVQEWDLRVKEQEKFQTWLSSGSGIFHISGKMGSGKSTLMKYLGSHPETQRLLQQWAEDADVTIASFYFWRAGSRLQKSLAGLYRSLLYDILKVEVDLIPIAFPEIWRDALRDWPSSLKTPEIRDKDAIEGFSRLLRGIGSDGTCRFCFFIDGLDEYEASGACDEKDLAKKLKDWESASSKIKFCVSSREHNAFMESFSPNQRFRLHELTRHDIQTFVQGRLSDYNDQPDLEQVIASIVYKAWGIFMWVAIVVRGVREQLSNDVQPPGLMDYIRELPDELFQLYDHIITSMDNYTKRRLSQTLAVLVYLSKAEDPRGLTLAKYYFLNDYNDNEYFARSDTFDASAVELKDMSAMEETARRRLSGWCKGLVEVGGYANEVQFSHRSVLNFVQEHHTLRDECGSAIGASILQELNLALFRLMTVSHEKNPSYSTMSQLLGRLMPRGTGQLHHLPFEYIRVVDGILDRFWPEVYSDVYKVSPHREGTRQTPACNGWVFRELFDAGLSSVYFHFWYSNLSISYLLWKVQNDSTLTSASGKFDLVLASIFAQARFDNAQFDEGVLAIETLLASQLLKPDTPIRLSIASLALHCDVIYTPNQTVSAWHFVTMLVETTWLYDNWQDVHFYRILQLCLVKGVDPRRWILRSETGDLGVLGIDVKRFDDAVVKLGQVMSPEGLFVKRFPGWIYLCVTTCAPNGHSIGNIAAEEDDASSSGSDGLTSTSLRELISQEGERCPEKNHCLDVIDQKIRELDMLDASHGSGIEGNDTLKGYGIWLSAYVYFVASTLILFVALMVGRWAMASRT